MQEKVQVDCSEHMSMLLSEQKMLEILEDLKIELTPYFTYYYHMLKALEKEAADNLVSQVSGSPSATL